MAKQELVPSPQSDAITTHPEMIESAIKIFTDTEHLNQIKRLYRELGDQQSKPEDIPHIAFHVVQEAGASPDTVVDVLAISRSVSDKATVLLNRDLILDLPNWTPPPQEEGKPIPETPPAIYQVFGGQFSKLCADLNNGIAGPQDSVTLIYLKPKTTLGQVTENIQVKRITQTQQPQLIPSPLAPPNIETPQSSDDISQILSEAYQNINTSTTGAFIKSLQSQTDQICQALNIAYDVISVNPQINDIFDRSVELLFLIRQRISELAGGKRSQTTDSISQIEEAFCHFVTQATGGYEFDRPDDINSFSKLLQTSKDRIESVPTDILGNLVKTLVTHERVLSKHVRSEAREFLVKIRKLSEDNPGNKKLGEIEKDALYLRTSRFIAL